MAGAKGPASIGGGVVHQAPQKNKITERIARMWYFSWILGVLLAAAFGIINVMWMETEELLGREDDNP
jgi:cyd operon protein YbgT